jgi:RNA polymerase sigma factor (sigma-70 family)
MNRDAKQVLTEWLVLEAQRGSETAFRELHALWGADFRRLAQVRVERAEGAAEVANDAWLAIARGLPRLGDPACFPRWAFRIVERRGADWIRRRAAERRRETLAIDQAGELAPAPLASAPPDEETLELRAAIARLPVEKRELLHLYYDLGRSIAEISEVAGVPAGTVKSRLYSIRENLKQVLERKIHE